MTTLSQNAITYTCALIVERLILMMKQVLAQLPLIRLRRESFRNELAMIIQWYNEHRPHDSLGGKTPNEVYEDRFPANRKPRMEPRVGWPRGSPCAKPQALIAGKSGQRFEMTVDFFRKRRHLPIVTLKRAAQSSAAAVRRAPMIRVHRIDNTVLSVDCR